MSTQLCFTDENLPKYLESRGLLAEGEQVQVEAAGDGNINWVRRVRLASGKSYVVKQARPALEKFPEYEVSTERIVFEARYLDRAGPVDRDGLLPRLQFFDPKERVLVMEDLGGATRLDAALAIGAEVGDDMEKVARFLARVHDATTDDPSLAQDFQNEAMRRLHGDHIFSLPYAEVFPAPPRTAERAAQIRADEALCALAAAAYEQYLRPEGPLIHADVQPGNLLLAATGPKLLDAEIAHAGDPAFDIGILLGHLALPSAAKGQHLAALPLLTRVWSAYTGERSQPAASLAEQATRYAGLELIRRTIGAARVPFVEEDAAGLAVLEVGTGWLREPAEAASRLTS